MTHRCLAVALLMFLSLKGEAAIAQWVEWPVADGGNGHWYQFVDAGAPISWGAAQAAAESGGGYLAVVTTAEENSFLEGSVLQTTAIGVAWIGGFQPPGTPEPDGGWEWITGEAWDFTNWDVANDQPDDSGNEDCLEVYTDESNPSIFGTWNDIPCDNPIRRYYVVERDTPIAIPTVSDWGFAMMTLLMLGAGLTIVVKRKDLRSPT